MILDFCKDYMNDIYDIQLQFNGQIWKICIE